MALRVKRRALVEIVEQPQEPMKAMRKATHIGVAAKHLFQHREDVEGVRPDPLGRRDRFALRPQSIGVLDECRTKPQAHALGIGPERQRRRRASNGGAPLGGRHIRVSSVIALRAVRLLALYRSRCSGVVLVHHSRARSCRCSGVMLAHRLRSFSR